METSEYIVTHAIRRFIESLPEEGWECSFHKKDNYNISAFSQETEVVKHFLEMNNNKVKSVILSEKGSGSGKEIALEIVFSDKPEHIFALPLDDGNKAVLSNILMNIKHVYKENLCRDIVEKLSLQ